jgi:hypothetical protein
MDWTKNYERLMRLEGLEPYGCHHRGCNHVARSTFGQMLHREFGAHHMGHRRRCRP